MDGYGSNFPTAIAVAYLAATCLFGCVILLRAGARAAGLALLGSLVGAGIGFFSTLSSGMDLTDDQLPAAPWIAVGATTGMVSFGLLGLTRRSRASGWALRWLSVEMAIFGVVAFLVVPIHSIPFCRPEGKKVFNSSQCVEAYASAPDGYLTVFRLRALVLFGTAFVILLLLLQARYRSGGDRPGEDQPMSLKVQGDHPPGANTHHRLWRESMLARCHRTWGVALSERLSARPTRT
jgi:hypothetical protein